MHYGGFVTPEEWRNYLLAELVYHKESIRRELELIEHLEARLKEAEEECKG